MHLSQHLDWKNWAYIELTLRSKGSLFVAWGAQYLLANYKKTNKTKTKNTQVCVRDV